MSLKESTHNTERLGRFTRAESPVRRWPFRWLRRSKAFTQLLHRNKGGAEGSEVTNVRQTQNNARNPEEHLCYIISQGFNASDKTQYMALITEPKFRCGHCGRQAVSDGSLCVPMKL